MKKAVHAVVQSMPRAGLLLAVLSGPAWADEHVVLQQNKAFSVTSLSAKVGDTLVFNNQDAFVHNIFSLSEVQSFDLGTFGKGEIRKVTLTKPGKIEIECAVHPGMKMTVDVK
jgi:plastocyanin